MLRITDRNKIPKGGYDYTVKESGRYFAGTSLSRLILKVREYQVANSFSVSTAEEIERDFCQRRPQLCDDGTAKPIYVEHDDMLTKLAAAVGIPAATALSKLSAKIGIKCRVCSQRNAIIQRVREIGFNEALRQLKETL